jgi:hypothetical protein
MLPVIIWLELLALCLTLYCVGSSNWFLYQSYFWAADSRPAIQKF